MSPDQERLAKMSDESVCAVWHAIWEMESWERADLSTEWQEDVYSEMSSRGLRTFPG